MGYLLLLMIYIIFIGLGLPDSLLGVAWPLMHQSLGISSGWAGVVSSIGIFGTILASLYSDRLTRRWGVGRVTLVSVALTGIALWGYSQSTSLWMVCLWAIPYGLGAGGVDAAINNYVALHYSGTHMNWLHCMWGVGVSIGPYIMGYALMGGNWSRGYQSVAILQMMIIIILLFGMPLWKLHQKEEVKSMTKEKVLSFWEIVQIKGVKPILATFFCYCAIETTAGLWASTYLVQYKGLSLDKAAFGASLYFIGLTLGRGIGGFIAMKLSDTQMIRLGFCFLGVGIGLLLLPSQLWICLGGLLCLGLGSAPIYPSIIHSTPSRFGQDLSRQIIGVEMASAYVGILVIPTLFGWVATSFGLGIWPIYMGITLVCMILFHEYALKGSEHR